MTTELDDRQRGDVETEADLRLDHQICLALYIATNKITRSYNALLGPLDLTFPQYLALLVLWERSPRSVNNIAQALGSNFGSVSPLLQKMEASGLVRRERDTEDQRRVFVHVTSKGDDLRPAAKQTRCEINQKLCIGTDGIAELRSKLQLLAANLG